MIAVRCFVCKAELEEPGALYFTRPTANGYCQKRHLCTVCSEQVEDIMRRVKERIKSEGKVPPVPTVPEDPSRPVEGK